MSLSQTQSQQVVSRNPFDILGNTDEAGDITTVSSSSNAPSKKEVEPKEIVAKSTTSKKRDPTRPTVGESRRGGDFAQRGRGHTGGRRGDRTQSSNEGDASNKERSVGHDANAAKPVEEEAVDRKPRGSRGTSRGGKREFDRRSASGRTDTPKAEQSGWGNEAEAQQAVASTDASPTDSKDPAAAEADNAPLPVVEEEEDNTKSYEDYLKEKAEKALSMSKPEVRKANEGSEDQWKDAVPLTRPAEEEDSYYVGKIRSKAQSAKEKKQKDYVEIEQRFNEAPRQSRPSRGARGGGRGRGEGGRGRGGDRGGRGARGAYASGNSAPKSAAPSMDLSTEAFPSLS